MQIWPVTMLRVCNCTWWVLVWWHSVRGGLEQNGKSMTWTSCLVRWLGQAFSAGDGWEEKEVGQGRGRWMGEPSRSVYCVHFLVSTQCWQDCCFWALYEAIGELSQLCNGSVASLTAVRDFITSYILWNKKIKSNVFLFALFWQVNFIFHLLKITVLLLSVPLGRECKPGF